MLQLEKLFDQLFDDEKIIDSRIIDFTEFHLVRMEENNPGNFLDTNITKTKAALIVLKDITVSKSETKADQYASSITVEEYEKQFIALVHRAQANVLVTYAKDSSVYKEFFPLKWETYTQPLRPSIAGFNDHFIARLTAHSELGTTVLDAFTDFKASWDPNREKQVQKISEVKTIIQQTDVERQALNTQLYINVHTIAIAYPGKPEMVKVFFDQAKLYPHTYGGESKIGVVHNYELEPGEIINTRLRGITDKVIRAVNLKNGDIAIFTASSLKNPVVPEEALILKSGEIKTADANTLGADPTNKYLLICNQGTEVNEIDVEITGSVK